MKKIKIISVLLIMIIIIGFLVNSVYAYLSSKVEASGSIKCNIGFGHPNMKITKTAENERKITITNDGDYDCYVRVRVMTVDWIDVVYSSEDEDLGRWIQQDNGYYYYESVLSPNETTKGIMVKLTNNSDKNCNIAVIAEVTNVMYDGNDYEYADWSAKFEEYNDYYRGE